MADDEPVIEMRRVTKVYCEGLVDHTVLREADLRLEAGERVILRGRSGILAQEGEELAAGQACWCSRR